MFTIRIADLTIRLENRYSYAEMLCSDYVVQSDTYDFSVCATDEEISEEMAQAETEQTNEAYAEAVCLHRKIAEQLWRYDCFLLHAALIECDGIGFAFAARSGVGKSTHVRLWQKNFRERVRVINGDKPIVRVTADGIRAYGTPWNGKEGMGENRSSSLKHLCFLERSAENVISDVSSGEAVMSLFPQIYMPENEEAVEKTLDLLDKFVEMVSFYRLGCNMENEAAIVARSHMTQAQEERK